MSFVIGNGHERLRARAGLCDWRVKRSHQGWSPEGWDLKVAVFSDGALGKQLDAESLTQRVNPW